MSVEEKSIKEIIDEVLDAAKQYGTEAELLRNAKMSLEEHGGKVAHLSEQLVTLCDVNKKAMESLDATREKMCFEEEQFLRRLANEMAQITANVVRLERKIGEIEQYYNDAIGKQNLIEEKLNKIIETQEFLKAKSEESLWKRLFG